MRHQHQALAVVDQLLAARDAPELEGMGFGWRVIVRVNLHDGIVIGKPGRMRVARIQGWVFQQAQAPRLRRVRPAAAAQPVAAVVGISAQVFPRQRRAVKVQNVEIGRCRIPVFGAAISHGETSLCLGCVATISAMRELSKCHQVVIKIG